MKVIKNCFVFRLLAILSLLFFPIFTNLGNCKELHRTSTHKNLGLVITPSRLIFSTTTIGNTESKDIILTNSSNKTLKGNIGTLSTPFSITNEGGDFTLTPDSTKTISIKFEPVGLKKISCKLPITIIGTKQMSFNVRVSGKGFDDISFPGNPQTKIDWHEGLKDGFQGPDDPNTIFEIDSSSYLVKSKNIHGTNVVVAIHNSLIGIKDIDGFPVPSTEEFADYVFQSFHHHFHIFNGFPYDRYTVLVKATNDTPGFSLSKVGITLGSTKLNNEPGLPNFPPHHYAVLYEEFLPHEMFHSWNGKLIQYEPNTDGRLFQLETWINEGTTNYYGFRLEGVTKGISKYVDAIGQRANDYKKNIGTPLDLSVEDLTFKIGMGPPSNDGTQDELELYARSTLINYLLDQELIKAGYNLDFLMRVLYNEYGLVDKKWQQSDIPKILEQVTGKSFDDFFNKFLYTNSSLPLNNKFLFLDHEGVKCNSRK